MHADFKTEKTFSLRKHAKRGKIFFIASAVAGKKEGEGPLGESFDMVCSSDKFGEDCWEESESTMQKEAAALAMGKASLLAKWLDVTASTWSAKPAATHMAPSDNASPQVEHAPYKPNSGIS